VSPPGRRPPTSWWRRWWRALAPLHGVEEVHVTDEDEYFPPPPELRDLLRGLAAAVAVGLAAPALSDGPAPGVVGLDGGSTASASPDAGSTEGGAALGDRQISAADVLARLAG